MRQLPPSSDRTEALRAAKLRALVRAGELSEHPFAAGAALITGGEAWILLEEDPARRLGHAMAWADSRGVEVLNVVADHGTGVLARRGSQFQREVRVWQVQGGDLSEAPPDPPPLPASPPASALDAAQMLAEAGVDVVIEHGEVRGDVLGLEVARVTADGDTARLEVGVGAQDRDAFAMLHGDSVAGSAEGLAHVAATVRRHRGSASEDHPLKRMAAQRHLRHELALHPEAVGAATLEPVEGTLARRSVDDSSPAILLGTDTAGGPLVVACSVGIDLDLVPAAGDARLMHAPEARLVLALPARDAHRVTARLAADLVRPAEVLTPAVGRFGPQ